MKTKVLIVLLLLFIPQSLFATTWFNYDGNGATPDDTLPFNVGGVGYEFCGPLCSYPAASRGYFRSGTAPDGDGIYFEWNYVSGNNGIQNEVTNFDAMPVSPLSMGTTYYLGFFIRFERIGGVDIWHDQTGNVASGNKGVELFGTNLRWEVSVGQWDDFLVRNADHQYTFWIGNAPEGDCQNTEMTGDIFAPNQNGYTLSNPYPADYEKWYAVILAVKASYTSTGSCALWINGTQISNYTGIDTVCSGGIPQSSGTLSRLNTNGTIAQPDYDAPNHNIQMDHIVITDTWSVLVAEGLTSDPEASETPNTTANGIRFN